ncbi:hypothetical protein [Methylocella sp.]|uniref:hypothetical protein n=1 Tax=Methylocella sp. TaxID=1978226 RepID=UPI0035AE135D
MTIFLTILDRLLGGLITPLVKAWSDYKRQQLVATEKGFEAASASDAQVMTAALKNDAEINAMKVQLYGTPTYRLVTLLVGVPVALHFGLIFVDTILASKFAFGRVVLGVPDAPGPYPGYEWAIIASFFLVHAVNLGTGNVAAWLGRKGA